MTTMLKRISNFKFKVSSSEKGFTLIELLVVIGILGILASALIATIDPFEQLKKANDANLKNASVEYVNANIRYYTTHSSLPWSDPAVSAACNAGSIPTGLALSAAAMSGCISPLITEGELKSGFTTVAAVMNGIIVSGSTNGVTACFLPTSKSQMRDPNTRYTLSGVITAGCVSEASTGVSTCYWCSL